MKKIDLDELDKRMPYEVPEGFFDEMQRNVLTEVQKTKRRKAPILSLKWATGVAASVALVVGLGLYLTHSNSEISEGEHLAISEDTATAFFHEEPAEVENERTEDPATALVYTEQQLEMQNPRSVTPKNRSPRSPRSGFVNESSRTKSVHAVSADLKLEEALNQLEPQEIAELSNQYEFDPFLDLY